MIQKLIENCLIESNHVGYKEESNGGKFKCTLFSKSDPNRLIITEVPNVNEEYRDKARKELLRLALQGAITGILYANTSNK